MAKETRVILALYVGEESDELTRGAITAALRSYCGAEKQVNFVSFDAGEIATLITKAAVKVETPVAAEVVELNKRTPEDEAVVVIGTIMKDELTHFNATAFLASLMQKINEASVAPNQESNKAFMNALFILSKEDLVISSSLLKKYKLNAQKIALIKRAYNLTSQF